MNEINETINANIMDDYNLKLVDFYANYCAPCHKLKPVLEKISLENNYNSKIGFFGVDVEENPDMVETYEIKSVPTIVLMKDDKEIKRIDGSINEVDIREIIDQFLNDSK